jgi:hypothetical protein
MSMRRTGKALLSLSVLAMALTACGSPDPAPDPVAGPVSAAPGDSIPATSATGAPPSDPAPTTTATTESTSAATSGGASAGTPRCHTADLKVSVTSDPAGGATNHHGEFLIFANSSAHKCTLYGYPGVSFVAGDQGAQVGAAFIRGGSGKKTITLAAGAKAHVTIVLVSTGVFEAADCKPVKVRGYRIYPPDETAAIFVSRPQTACSAKDAGTGEVQPVAPGTSGD